MRTYYSVDKKCLGRDGIIRCWFRDLAEAKEFARQDYTDNVVVHNVRNQDYVDSIEGHIAYQEENYSYFKKRRNVL